MSEFTPLFAKSDNEIVGRVVLLVTEHGLEIFGNFLKKDGRLPEFARKHWLIERVD